MKNKFFEIRSLVTFAVWTILVVSIIVHYLENFGELSFQNDLGEILLFVLLSFIVPISVCNFVDKLLPRSGYIVKGTASILAVVLTVGLCIAIWSGSQPTNEEYLTLVLLHNALGEFLDYVMSSSVPWMLVIITYYGLQSSQIWLSKLDSKSQHPKSASSLVDLGSEKIYKKLNTPRKAAALAVGLHRRSDILTKQATYVLWIIITVLLFTAVFVVFAGQISGWGTKPINHLSNMIAERDEFRDRIQSLTNQFDNFNSEIIEIDFRLEDEKNTQQNRATRAELERLYSLRDNIDDQIQRLLKQEDTLDEKIQALRISLVEKEGDSNSDQPNSDQNFVSQLLLAAGITRFGVVIISIYLVQILSNLYRYNIQTAAHYRAIADFIILAESKDYEKIKTLDGVLLPDIGFSKTPKMFWQKLTKTVAEALENFIPKLRHSIENTLRKTE